MTRRRRSAVAVVLAAALAGAPGAASAEDAVPSADEMAKARSLFDAGARAYDSGQFDAAIQAFEQAYAITPREGLLFSLAQAHRKQHAVSRDPRNLAAAVDNYRRYLAKVKEGARRKDAAEALEQLEPMLASAGAAAAPQPARRATIVQISSNTPGASVSIDGAAPSPAPLTREVTPGVHKVRLSAPGFHDEEQSVEALSGRFLPFTYPLRERPAKLDVTGADGAEVSVDGRFVGEIPFPAPVELPAGRHFVTVGANGRRTSGTEVALGRGEARRLEVELYATGQRTAAWVTLISGVAIMASGGAFGVIAIAHESSAEDVLARAESGPISEADVTTYEEARADRDGFTRASIATVAGGGLVTLVGVGLFAFDSPEPLASRRLEPAAPAPGPGPPPAAPAGPTLELGFVPVVGPEGASGRVVGRF